MTEAKLVSTETTAAQRARQSCLDKIIAVYEAATASDKQNVGTLVGRAKEAKQDCAKVEMTPGMAALLFMDHNKQNREWKYKVSEEYAEDMKTGKWAWNNATIGMLNSGDVGDSQHRLGGVAVSGMTLPMVVIFGMTEDSILTIDVNHRRQASDFLRIVDKDETSNPKRKQAIIKQAFATLRRIATNEEEARPYVLSNNREVFAAIKANERLLTDAMIIGEESVRGRSKPTFKVAEASALAFLLLFKGWPRVKVTADLDVFQSGEDREGGNSPLFVAADILQKDAQKKDSASVMQRFAAAIKAFVLHEQGVKAVRQADIRNTMKTKQVSANFPGLHAVA
jgi:hypothetical protein